MDETMTRGGAEYAQPKHIELAGAIVRLQLSVERFQDLVDQVGGSPKPAPELKTENVKDREPALVEILNESPIAIDRMTGRIDDLVSHMRDMLY